MNGLIKIFTEIGKAFLEADNYFWNGTSINRRIKMAAIMVIIIIIVGILLNLFF